ncbi:hypothetical protein D5R81_07565 [Parashewanella spongiae]|uniref:Uncharacterized protein n=1 Tax=Parashewanella spongiae TaxID=342950 RepID=A0A3A6UG43_9GAMM|nr:hypothetical protein [Parashewanella spongiae]MCL1079012.1 hypothetical protein [Parashewanella spongiae]RJY17833.1 hypothetical protein D5R81_07565 [Parashewanella spongiae]
MISETRPKDIAPVAFDDLSLESQIEAEHHELIEKLNKYTCSDKEVVKEFIELINKDINYNKTCSRSSHYLELFKVLITELSKPIKKNFYVQMAVIYSDEGPVWEVRTLMTNCDEGHVIAQLVSPLEGGIGVGTDEFSRCRELVSEINKITKTPGVDRPVAQLLRSVTPKITWEATEKIQSEPAGTRLISQLSDTQSKPSKVAKAAEFDLELVDGVGQITYFENKSTVFLREKNASGNTIALVDTIIETPGIYNFSFIIENDQGASCCLGIMPKPTAGKSNLKPITRMEESLCMSKQLSLIRSYCGEIWTHGRKDRTRNVEEFWAISTLVEMKVVVKEDKKADVYFTNNGEAQLNGQAVFSNEKVPLQAFVGFYAAMAKRVNLIHSDYEPKTDLHPSKVVKPEKMPSSESKALMPSAQPKPSASSLRCIIPELTSKAMDKVEDIQFSAKLALGSAKVLHFSGKTKLVRESVDENIGIGFLNCVCSKKGYYQFTFSVKDKNNGTCIGFCTQKDQQDIKKNFSTINTESLFDSTWSVLFRLSDGRLFDRGDSCNIDGLLITDIESTNFAFELIVNEQGNTQITALITPETGDLRSYPLVDFSDAVIPFVAFFGKGNQAVELKELPSYFADEV